MKKYTIFTLAFISIKAAFLFLGFMLLFSSCSQPQLNTNPDSYLTGDEQEAFKYEIIRYVGKLAPKATENTKFRSEFDEYYKKLAANHDLMGYYPNEKTGEVFFLMNRIAPSLYLKKVATGGKLKRDGSGVITYYEENFRTYKMAEEDLAEKAGMLFQKYINGKDLSKYLYQNSQPEEYIEFPNEEVHYDADQRRWVSSREDPISRLKSEMEEEIIKTKEAAADTIKMQ
jgi:hypothetical protein